MSQGEWVHSCIDRICVMFRESCMCSYFPDRLQQSWHELNWGSDDCVQFCCSIFQSDSNNKQRVIPQIMHSCFSSNGVWTEEAEDGVTPISKVDLSVYPCLLFFRGAEVCWGDMSCSSAALLPQRVSPDQELHSPCWLLPYNITPVHVRLPCLQQSPLPKWPACCSDQSG